jgi:hypothetical protein
MESESVEIVWLVRSFLFVLLTSNFIYHSSGSQHTADWIFAVFYADAIFVKLYFFFFTTIHSDIKIINNTVLN